MVYIQAVVWGIDPDKGTRMVWDILPFASDVTLTQAVALMGKWYPNESQITYERMQEGTSGLKGTYLAGYRAD